MKSLRRCSILTNESRFEPGSFWSRQAFEQFSVADSSCAVGDAFGSRASPVRQEDSSTAVSEATLLHSFRYCIVKLLKLEGSDWLFGQNDGDCVAAREKFRNDVQTREMNSGTIW